MRSTLSLRIPENRSMQSQLKSTPLAVINSGIRVSRSAVSRITLMPNLSFDLNLIEWDYAPPRMGNHNNNDEMRDKNLKIMDVPAVCCFPLLSADQAVRSSNGCPRFSPYLNRGARGIHTERSVDQSQMLRGCQRTPSSKTKCSRSGRNLYRDGERTGSRLPRA